MSVARDTVHIDRAVPEDAVSIRLVIRAAMVKYLKDSHIAGTLDSMQENVEDLLRYIRQDAVFVARFGGNIVGTVRISVESEGHAYLSRFAVLPGSQSLGIGSKLFSAATAYMKDEGIRYVRLHTALTNHPLVKFYEKKGFRLMEQSSDRGYPRGLFVKEM